MSSLVAYVREVVANSAAWPEVLAVLTERFALPFDDARLVMDRVQGGIVRAGTGNPANAPDPGKDPVAWTSYRQALGLPVVEEDPGPSPEQRASARAIVERARRGEPTKRTGDVVVALEVARLALLSADAAPARFQVLLGAATSLSMAAEACISQLGDRPCAPEGSQEWVDGVMLAGAARQVAQRFATLPDPKLEERGYGLAGRIVTRLLGQCHALVGRAMLDSARCSQRNGDPERAAGYAEAVIADFEVVLDRCAGQAPFDEDAIAIDYLRAAVELVIGVKGRSGELDRLLARSKEALDRAPAS
jgi:hypothetical protein